VLLVVVEVDAEPPDVGVVVDTDPPDVEGGDWMVPPLSLAPQADRRTAAMTATRRAAGHLLWWEAKLPALGAL